MVELDVPLVQPGDGLVSLSSLPDAVGRWKTVVLDGKPTVHSGGGGYGWMVEDTVLGGQRGFLKRDWWTLEDEVDPEEAIRRRWSRVIQSHGKIGRHGIASSVIPAPLDIAVIDREWDGRSLPEPVSVTAYFLDHLKGRSQTLEDALGDSCLLPGAAQRLIVSLAAAFVVFGYSRVLGHEDALVHGDIKPKNLLVDTLTWSFAVIDWVDGRHFEMIGDNRADSGIFLSEQWAPPEVSVSQGPYDGSLGTWSVSRTPAWDVWSAALTVVWATLGAEPVRLRNALCECPERRWEVAAQLMDAGIGPPLAAVIGESLHPEPQERIAASEFVRRVRDWQNQQ